jgi:hypothetical protein
MTRLQAGHLPNPIFEPHRIARARPWELEDQLIQELDLPLNPRDNSRNPFHPKLTEARARCLAQARALPVLPNVR